MKFQNKVVEAERECISKDELAKLLGHGRAKTWYV